MQAPKYTPLRDYLLIADRSRFTRATPTSTASSTAYPTAPARALSGDPTTRSPCGMCAGPARLAAGYQIATIDLALPRTVAAGQLRLRPREDVKIVKRQRLAATRRRPVQARLYPQTDPAVVGPPSTERAAPATMATMQAGRGTPRPSLRNSPRMSDPRYPSQLSSHHRSAVTAPVQAGEVPPLLWAAAVSISWVSKARTSGWQANEHACTGRSLSPTRASTSQTSPSA